MVDAVSGEELIKHRYVATEPKLNQDAVDDCLVLSERHSGNLLHRVMPGGENSVRGASKRLELLGSLAVGESLVSLH
jgi:hypothetical protein